MKCATCGFESEATAKVCPDCGASTDGGSPGREQRKPCGTDVEAESDDSLVSKVEGHIASDHPDMVGKYSREQILEMAHEHCTAKPRPSDGPTAQLEPLFGCEGGESPRLVGASPASARVGSAGRPPASSTRSFLTTACRTSTPPR